MKASRDFAIAGAVLCTVLAISCSDDDGDPEAPRGGAAGAAGASAAGSGGKASGGKASGGSSGSAGKGGAGGNPAAGEGGEPAAGTSAGGASAGEGGSGGEGGTEPALDCTQVSSKPLKVEELNGPKAYHDIAFDKNGNLIGNDNSDLLKTALDGKPKIMLAGIGLVEGFDLAKNGDMYAVASSFDEQGGGASLERITPEGGQETVIKVELGAYGVRVGPDGFVYVANMSALYRIDPETKKTTLVPSNVEGWQPRVMDYSPDKKKLYVGTLGNGTVYAYDLDETGKPQGYPKEFAKNVGDGYHDGLGVDACGNVYVADYITTALYRITPEGEVTLYQDWAETGFEASDYGHGMEWGNGVGGFDKTSLYLPQPYDDNTVVRVELGVPARPR